MIFQLFLLLFILFFCFSVGNQAGQPEHVPHTFNSAKFSEPHSQEMDHKAILGSEKTANEFDELSPEESKKRLKILALKMDLDKDGYVTEAELSDWVRNSLISLDNEELENRFNEIDINNDNQITWSEYLSESFGIESIGQEAEPYLSDPEDRKLLNEDRKYFTVADSNGDNILSREEFAAFQNPENFPVMHQSLIENMMVEKDKNKDGKIDLKEFMGELFDQQNSEWFLTEKTHFHEYDSDKNEVLEGEELKHWIIPDITKTTNQEASHLLNSADSDKDGKLSIEEIVISYKTFVGSEATSFGESLINLSHDEL